MRIGARILRFIQPTTERERMACRRVASEMEARCADLQMAIDNNKDEIITALRAAFEKATKKDEARK